MDVINMSLGSSFGTNDDPSAGSIDERGEGRRRRRHVGRQQRREPVHHRLAGYCRRRDCDRSATIRCSSFPVFASIRRRRRARRFRCRRSTPTASPPDSRSRGRSVVLKDNPATTTDIPGFLGSADESLGCSSERLHVQRGRRRAETDRRRQARRLRPRREGRSSPSRAARPAAVMTNNAAGLPPFEGPITSNPDTGVPFTVTIPFVGVAGNLATATTDSGRLQASPGRNDGTRCRAQSFREPGLHWASPRSLPAARVAATAA